MTTPDLIVIVIYSCLILLIGYLASRRVTTTNDMFIGSRKFGKVLACFFSFGAGTSDAAPVGVSRETYRNGFSGLWLALGALFTIPITWFTSLWVRRLRIITGADYFVDRYGSRGLAILYSAFTIYLSAFGGATQFVALTKTVDVIFPKDPARYTDQEKKSVALFREFKTLEAEVKAGRQADIDFARYQELKELSERHVIAPSFPYFNRNAFILVIAIAILFYCFLGGIVSSAFTDVIQSNLLVILSFMLIPVGLMKVGGMAGLHAQLPETVFQIFGSPHLSDWSISFVLVLALTVIFGFGGAAGTFAMIGSSKDDSTARVGAIVGVGLKQLLVLGWALAGVIGLALYSKNTGDADNLWGLMTRELLGPGFKGIMFCALVGALMSTLSVGLVVGSSLLVNNVLKPLVFPDKSDRFYLWLSRGAMVVLLSLCIYVALTINNLVEIMLYSLSLPALFGVPCLFGILNRRVTRSGAWASILLTLIFIIILPFLLPSLDTFRKGPVALLETVPRMVVTRVPADSIDVVQGKADRVGRTVEKQVQTVAEPIFFRAKVRENPADPASAYVGVGKFNIQLYVLHLAGMDLQNKDRATLRTFQYLVGLAFPLFILFLFSYLSKRDTSERLQRFMIRLRTPSVGDPDLDARNLESAYANPDAYRKRKIFKNSDWEMHVPTRFDTIGFFVILAGITTLILIFKAIIGIGA